MIMDGQAKIESEINANYPLVSEPILVDRLHNDYDQDDHIYQQKVEVRCLSFCSSILVLNVFLLA